MNWNVEGPAVFLDMKYQTCFLHIESDQGFYSLIALGYSIPVPKYRKCPSDASDSEMMDFHNIEIIAQSTLVSGMVSVKKLITFIGKKPSHKPVASAWFQRVGMLSWWKLACTWSTAF